MKSRLRRLLTAVPVTGLLLVQGAAQPAVGPLASHTLAWASMPTVQHRIISGRAGMLMQGDGTSADENDNETRPTSYYPTSDDGCPKSIGSNIKVNQNCLNLTDPDLQGRAQAQNETSIAQDPMHPEHIVASYNDYRRGDGNCYGAFSLDNGKTWTDTTIPMSFTRGAAFGAARQYWQAGGDTAVAWDTKGNSYFQCQVFERGRATTGNPDLSSAIYMFRSTKNNGASWNFPGRPVIETQTQDRRVLEDKPLMTVDNHVGSPFQDRVYVSYTEFAANGTAFIWLSYSKDYGETFSDRHLVSITSPFCSFTYGLTTDPSNCNENQFSQPFTGKDGALYVAYNNFNNTIPKGSGDNRNQILLAKSTDGGNTFGPPVKVSDYYDLPDCATYQAGQDFGRACVPEKGSTTNSYFRATNYASGAVNPHNPKEISVAFGSYINKNSKESNGCVPAGLEPVTGNNLYTGVKTPGACNNDILVSVSTDGGASFTGTATDPRALTSATDQGRQKTTDQFWQWADYTRDGKFATSYYDRQYGNDETTGFSDVSLSGSRNLTQFGVTRVTSSSMPPPSQFGGVFLGDYSGLSALTDAHPLWSDTRSKDLFLCPGTGTPGNPPRVCGGTATNAPYANDQDAYTATVAVPNGGGGEGDNGGDGGGNAGAGDGGNGGDGGGGGGDISRG